jgi:erythromycin esterase
MLNRRRLLLSGSTVAAAAVASPVALHALAARQPWNLPVNDEIVAWFKANAVPIATTAPGSQLDDLDFLKASVDEARIVSLGEATHATHEFVELKHRVIEYCVAKLGFTLIAVEFGFGIMRAVNDYVLDGKGSATEALAGLGFMWDTEEAVALVEWIRDWNIAHERKVKFYGFDMQFCEIEAQHLLHFLARVAPDLAASAEKSLVVLPPNAWTPLGEPTRKRVLAQISDVLASFDAMRALWISRSSELEWRLARLNAVVIEQCAQGPQHFDEYMLWRDRCMADNVQALLEAEGPTAKAILWAHNLHVRRTPGLAATKTMGGWLHEAFAAQHVVVGFSFNQGRFRIPAYQTLGPAPPGFLDAALARTELPLLALDLSRMPNSGPVAEWLASKPYQRTAGGSTRTEPRWYELMYWIELFDPPFSFATDPREDYDLLLFVETSTPSRPRRG